MSVRPGRPIASTVAELTWMRMLITATCFALLLGCTTARTTVRSDPWFQILDSDWAPDPKVVESMKASVYVGLDHALTKSRLKGVPVHYWFQYGRESGGNSETIIFQGFPFPVPLDPNDLYMMNPEACVIHGTYSPIDKKISRFGVAPNCPPPI
jgi:hypothetical protein